MKSLAELKLTAKSKVQHIKFDFNLSFSLSFISRTKDNKALSYLIAELYIPCNDKNHTNLAYGLPVLSFPVGLSMLVSSDGSFVLQGVECVAEQQGRNIQDMAHFIEVNQDFSAGEIFHDIAQDPLFLDLLKKTIFNQMPKYFIDDCLSLF